MARENSPTVSVPPSITWCQKEEKRRGRVEVKKFQSKERDWKEEIISER